MPFGRNWRRGPESSREDFAAWRAEECEIGDFEESAYDLYIAYSDWCLRNCRRAAPLGIWSRWMQTLHKKVFHEGGVNRNGEKREKFYTGLRLNISDVPKRPAAVKPEGPDALELAKDEHLNAWIAQCCTTGLRWPSGELVPIECSGVKLFNNYQEWAETQVDTPMSHQMWGKWMSKHFRRVQRWEGGSVYLGICLPRKPTDPVPI